MPRFDDLASVKNLDAVDLLELAVLDGLLDGLQIEDDDVVLVAGGHFRDGDAFLGIVAGRCDVLALIVRIVVVEVARDNHLPGDLHRVAVDGREHGAPLLRIIEHLADVGNRRAVLAVAEHVSGARDSAAGEGRGSSAHSGLESSCRIS